MNLPRHATALPVSRAFDDAALGVLGYRRFPGRSMATSDAVNPSFS